MGFFDFFKRKKFSPQPEVAHRVQPVDVEGRFPFPVIAVRGDEAEGRLLELREKLTDKKLTPVIIGEADSAIRLLDVWNDPYSYDDQFKFAMETMPDDWFRRQLEEDPEAYASMEVKDIYPNGTAPMNRLQIGYNHRQKPHAKIYIAQIPTSEQWTIPLHLRFGDWNACPSPSAHAMIAQFWEKRYGARIATVASDIVEFTVDRPPTSGADANQLARQQYIYCSDIVDQGVGSVATLAIALKRSTRWYFWWD